MRIWRDPIDVRGKALPAGHFLPEDIPDLTLAEMLASLVGADHQGFPEYPTWFAGRGEYLCVLAP